MVQASVLRFLSAAMLATLAGIALGPMTASAQSGIPPRPTGTAYTNLPIDPEAAPRPTARATRITEQLRIDGQLDEEVWQRAEPITDFIQSQPDAGQPATEPTVVRILYDDRALYIGAIAYDPEPNRVVVRSMERDFPGESTRNTDVFAVTLDTFLDRRNSFMYLVNPLGGFRDDQTFNNSRQLDSGWDSRVEIRTAVHDSAWTVEMEIPWSTLRFDPGRGEQIWGINFLRRIRRKLEDSYWAPMDRRDPVHRMSKGGTLIIGDLSNLDTGRNLRVKPYVLGRESPGGITAEGPLGGSLDGGLDVKYGLTSELTLDLSYNTEFSEAEVDQEQVNLTRFPLFFPERREFFVENSGSFVFGDVTERNYRQGTSLRDFTLFHSRRIGLTPDRRPRPIVGGARLSGRVGRFEVGALSMQTEEFEGLSAQNTSVARIRGNISDGSDIGAIFVNRQATDGSGVFNRSLGADANFRLLGGLVINSYLATTDSEVEGSDNLAGRATVSWRDRIWDASAMYKHVGEDFNPGAGFVRRRGIRHSYATAGAHPRPGLPWLFEINPYAEIHRIADLEDVLQTRLIRGGLGLDLLGTGLVNVTVTDRFERLSSPFGLREDIAIPEGAYDWTEWNVSYTSDQGRSLSGRVVLTGGEFWTGDRTSVAVAGDWRLSPFLSLQADVGHNSVSLPEGSFTADVFGARLKYAPTARLAAAAFIQYNEAADELVTNVRVNFIHAPLSDLFLVYTDRRKTGTGASALARMITVKFTRLLEF